MSTEPESFLARWSRRKRTAERDKEPAAKTVAPDTPAAPPVRDAAAPGARPELASASAPSHAPAATPEIPLPPIESLDGLRSDYQAFFQQPVAEELRHAALKKLFADPHFNKMDMLDVYVDDYTQFEPLPVEMKLRMTSARDFLLDSERAALEASAASAGATGDTTATSVGAAEVTPITPGGPDAASAQAAVPNVTPPNAPLANEPEKPAEPSVVTSKTTARKPSSI